MAAATRITKGLAIALGATLLSGCLPETQPLSVSEALEAKSLRDPFKFSGSTFLIKGTPSSEGKLVMAPGLSADLQPYTCLSFNIAGSKTNNTSVSIEVLVPIHPGPIRDRDSNYRLSNFFAPGRLDGQELVHPVTLQGTNFYLTGSGQPR